MADIVRSTPSLDLSSALRAPQIAGDLYAGEALDIAAPCYIKAADGLVYMSNGTAANEAAKIDGFSPRAVSAGQPVTLYGVGVRFGYSRTMTPGQNLYLSANAGRLADAASMGGVTPIARAINATDIRILSSVQG